ncbi:hypothetical protein KM043_018432 [Ampulex compressa]|nr:hypothetical protein KM043_018432 [Ampulex compressa]
MEENGVRVLRLGKPRGVTQVHRRSLLWTSRGGLEGGPKIEDLRGVPPLAETDDPAWLSRRGAALRRRRDVGDVVAKATPASRGDESIDRTVSRRDIVLRLPPRGSADCPPDFELWTARGVREFGVLGGYNGTIFAYGQTGSGKTYTITGDQETYDARGIIPRSLHYLFDAIRKHPENVYSVEVAYLEIYNENGYDLLDRKQRHEFAPTRLEDLPRVTIQEDEIGRLHLKNLTFHCVGNEQDAFELLLVGDTNRVTADTPMNPQSSRSHCIFTIVISIKQLGADRYKRAKVHLVDLAGSERVYKCAITGTILTEAKHINLSLHYLEQVIVCLGQESAGHIPYRNSLLTAILRDSLGGNCLTTMLATLSVSSSNLEETISTCRFSQRVSLIKNDVNLVLEKDVESENKLLKLENERLKQQIEMLTKQKTSRELTVEEKDGLDLQVRSYLLSSSVISWDYEPKKIQYCFEAMRKNFILGSNKDNCLEKLNYYKDLVIQRDKEIWKIENETDHGLQLNEEKNLSSTSINNGFKSKKNEVVNISLQQLKYTDSQAKLEIDALLHNYGKEDRSNIFENVDISNNESSKQMISQSKHPQKSDRSGKAKDQRHYNLPLDIDVYISHKNKPNNEVASELQNNNTPTSRKDNYIKQTELEEFRFNRRKIASSCSTSKKIFSKSKSVSSNQSNSCPFPCKIINLDLYNVLEPEEQKNKNLDTKSETNLLTRRCQQKLLDFTELKSEDVQHVLKHNSKSSTQSPNYTQELKNEKHADQNVQSTEHMSEEEQVKNITNDLTKHTRKDLPDVAPCISQKFTYISIPKKMSHPNMPDKLSYDQMRSHSNYVVNLQDTNVKEYQSRHQIKSCQIKNNCTSETVSNYYTDSTRKEYNSYEVLANRSLENTNIQQSSTPNIDLDMNKSTKKESKKNVGENLMSNVNNTNKATAQEETKIDIESCIKLNTPVSNGTQSHSCMDNKKIEYSSDFNQFETFTANCENHSKLSDKNVQRAEKFNFNEVTSSFERSLPLTGDSEIDEEIIAFYRAKRSGGIY